MPGGAILGITTLRARSLVRIDHGTLTAMRSETRYARSGETHIANHVVGNGPLDPVFVMGLIRTLIISGKGRALIS